MNIVGISGVRRHGSEEISDGGYIYDWSGRGDGAHFGVWLQAFPDDCSRLSLATSVDKRVLLVRLRHSLDFISLLAVYTPNEMGELEEMFYAKLDSIVDQRPSCDTIIVLDHFSAVTGTEKAGYELCVSPHDSGTRNVNSSILPNFAKLIRLRIGAPDFRDETFAAGLGIPMSVVGYGDQSHLRQYSLEDPSQLQGLLQ